MNRKSIHARGALADEARALGLNARITRRDFVGATLVGSGAVLLGLVKNDLVGNEPQELRVERVHGHSGRRALAAVSKS